MASNLLIAYNQIGQKAKGFVSSRTHTFLNPIHNLESNKKYQTVETDNNYSTISYDWDSGVGKTDTASFLAFPTKNITGTEINLVASNASDYTSSTTLVTVSASQITSDVSGYYDLDIIKTFTESSAFRYWRILAQGDPSGNINGRFSKFFFGNMLDLGIDPEDIQITVVDKQETALSDAGYNYSNPTIREQRVFNISWLGITNAKYLEFKDLFLVHKEPLVYFKTTNAGLFNGVDLVSVNITSEILEELATDYNRLSIKAVEAI